jgi:chromosome segregation ATPase
VQARVTALEKEQQELQSERNVTEATLSTAAESAREMENQLQVVRAKVKVLEGEVTSTRTQVDTHREGAGELEERVRELQEREGELAIELEVGNEVRAELELEKATMEKRAGEAKVAYGEELIRRGKEKAYLKMTILGFMKAKEAHQRMGVMPVLTEILGFSEKERAAATEAVRSQEAKPRGFFG